MAKVYDPAGPGAPWFGAADIDWIAAQGFDHIRYPLDGRLVWRADGTLDEAKLAPLVRALHETRDRGLGAVLDLHFLPGGVFQKDVQDPAIYSDPRARGEAAACWARLAERFAAEGDYLRFELINEPLASHNEQLNELNDVLIAAIRAVDRERVLYVTTNRSSSFATLMDLRVPSDPHTAILLHYDEPMVFTHQRASWKQCPPDMPLVEFPSRVPDLRRLFPPDHFAYLASLTELSEKGIEADFLKAAVWLREHAPGREIYLGEFGVNELAPALSRANYIRAVSQAASQRGWGWCVWSYNGGMAVRDAQGAPTPVLQGLFPTTAQGNGR
jgi:endoglucanase